MHDYDQQNKQLNVITEFRSVSRASRFIWIGAQLSRVDFLYLENM